MIESLFSQLLDKVQSTRDFEAVRFAHEQFLTALLSQSFLLMKPVITAHKRSLGQSNIFSSVCQEFCSRGGVCLSACWDTTPWEQAPPLDQAPPCAVYAGRYGQQVGGMHPTGMQSCLQI